MNSTSVEHLCPIGQTRFFECKMLFLLEYVFSSITRTYTAKSECY